MKAFSSGDFPASLHCRRRALRNYGGECTPFAIRKSENPPHKTHKHLSLNFAKLVDELVVCGPAHSTGLWYEITGVSIVLEALV